MAAWHEPGRSLGQPRVWRGLSGVALCIVVWALIFVLLATGWHV